MKLGLHIASTSWPGGAGRLGSTLSDVVAAAEDAGFDAISVVDHVWQHPYLGGSTENEIEAYSTRRSVA
jgi:predicted metal-dependent phosphoesterase TrpH